MNLTCPSCDTTFRVDPTQIGPAGRRVRCGSCGHDWDQARPQEDAEPPAVEAEPEPEAPAAEAEPADGGAAAAEGAARRGGPKPRRLPPPRARLGRIAAGCLIFFLVIAGLAAGAYFGRAQIVAAVPATGELYRLAGLPMAPPPGDGLELREVKSVRRLIDGQRVVVIEGMIANISNIPREVPRLRASVMDAGGEQVDEWVFSANSANLPPGGVTEFKTTTRNAPREGSLGIDFVAAK